MFDSQQCSSVRRTLLSSADGKSKAEESESSAYSAWRDGGKGREKGNER
jgi:hypothetical protein